MAQPQLRAQFFVSLDGIVTCKSPPIDYDKRWKIFTRDNGVCQICKQKCRFGGRDVAASIYPRCSQIDHIFPRARGGNNEDSNLRLLCVSCNMRKGAK